MSNEKLVEEMTKLQEKYHHQMETVEQAAGIQSPGQRKSQCRHKNICFHVLNMLLFHCYLVVGSRIWHFGMFLIIPWFNRQHDLYIRHIRPVM